MAFPVVPLSTNPNDTGLVVKIASLSAWRTDGAPVTGVHLGDPGALTGGGHMLLGLAADAIVVLYRDDSVCFADAVQSRTQLGLRCARFVGADLARRVIVFGARKRVILYLGAS